MPQVVIEILYPHRPAEGRRLGLGTYSIGRDNGDIALSDPQVSSSHGELQVDTTGVIYRDVGSTNGSFSVDGRRIEGPERLGEGDRVVLGHCTLVVQKVVVEPRPRADRPNPVARTMLGPSAERIEAELLAQGLVGENSAVPLPPPIYPVHPQAQAINRTTPPAAPRSSLSQSPSTGDAAPEPQPPVRAAAHARESAAATWNAPLGVTDPGAASRGFHPSGAEVDTSRDGTWPSQGNGRESDKGRAHPSSAVGAETLSHTSSATDPWAVEPRDTREAPTRPAPETATGRLDSAPPPKTFDSWPDPGGLPVPLYSRDYRGMPFAEELKARLLDTYHQLKPHARLMIRVVAAVVVPCTLGMLFASALPLIGPLASAAIGMAQGALLTFITLGVVAQYLLAVVYGEPITLHEARTAHQGQQGPWAKTMLIGGLVSAIGSLLFVIPGILLGWGLIGAYLIGNRRGLSANQRSLTLFLNEPQRMARALFIGALPGLCLAACLGLLALLGTVGSVLSTLVRGAALCALLPFGTLYLLRLYREVHDPQA